MFLIFPSKMQNGLQNWEDGDTTYLYLLNKLINWFLLKLGKEKYSLI